MLYEAASGRLPFGGRTGFEISSAIMRELPKPLGPPVPPGLWAIIQRCLTKEPPQRYQRASEVQAALEAVQSAAIVSTEPTLPIRAHPELPSCTMCNTFTSGREIFFCWWERQKEHSSCARTLGARVGNLVVPISMGTRYMRWPMTAVVANIAYGLQPRVTGARCCVPATISGRAGLIHTRPRFDFRRILVFP